MSDEPPGYSNSRMGEHISPTASGGVTFSNILPPLSLPPLKSNDPYSSMSSPQASSYCSPVLKQTSMIPSTSSSSQFGSSIGSMFPSVSQMNQYAPHNGHERMTDPFINSFNGNGGYAVTSKMAPLQNNYPPNSFSDNFYQEKFAQSTNYVGFGSQPGVYPSSSTSSVLTQNYHDFAIPTTSNSNRAVNSHENKEADDTIKVNGGNHTDVYVKKSTAEVPAPSTTTTISENPYPKLKPIKIRIPPPLPGRKSKEKKPELMNNGEKVKIVNGDSLTNVGTEKLNEVEPERPKQRRAPGKPKRYQHMDEAPSVRHRSASNVHIVLENDDEAVENGEKPKRKRGKRKAKIVPAVESEVSTIEEMSAKPTLNGEDIEPKAKRQKSAVEAKPSLTTFEEGPSSSSLMSTEGQIEKKKRKRKTKKEMLTASNLAVNQAAEPTSNLKIAEEKPKIEQKRSEQFLRIPEVGEMMRRENVESVQTSTSSSRFSSTQYPMLSEQLARKPENVSFPVEDNKVQKVKRKHLNEAAKVAPVETPTASVSRTSFQEHKPSMSARNAQSLVEAGSEITKKKGRPPKKKKNAPLSTPVEKSSKEAQAQAEKVKNLKEEVAKMMEMRKFDHRDKYIEEGRALMEEYENLDSDDFDFDLQGTSKEGEKSAEPNKEKSPNDFPNSIEVMVRVRNPDGSYSLQPVDLPRDFELEKEFVDKLVESGHTLEEAQDQLARKLANAHEEAATIIEEENLMMQIGQISRLIDDGSDVPEELIEIFDELLAEAGLDEKVMTDMVHMEETAMKTTYRDEYKKSKHKFKKLVFENECYQEELRNSQRKLLKLTRDNNFLLDRMMQYEEENEISNDEDESNSEDETDSSENSSDSDDTVDDETESESENERDEEGEGVEPEGIAEPPEREEREHSPVIASMPGRRVFNGLDATPPPESLMPSEDEFQPQGAYDDEFYANFDHDGNPIYQYEDDVEDDDVDDEEETEDDEFEDEMWPEFDSEFDEEFDEYFDMNQPSTSGLPPIRCFSPSDDNLYSRPSLYNALVSNQPNMSTNQASNNAQHSTMPISHPVEPEKRPNPITVNNPGHFFTPNEIEQQFAATRDQIGEDVQNEPPKKKKKRKSKKKELPFVDLGTTDPNVLIEEIKKAHRQKEEAAGRLAAQKPAPGNADPMNRQPLPPAVQPLPQSLVRSESIVVQAGGLTIPVEIRQEPVQETGATELFINAEDYDRYVRSLMGSEPTSLQPFSGSEKVSSEEVSKQSSVENPIDPILDTSETDFPDETPDDSLQGYQLEQTDSHATYDMNSQSSSLSQDPANVTREVPRGETSLDSLGIQPLQINCNFTSDETMSSQAVENRSESLLSISRMDIDQNAMDEELDDLVEEPPTQSASVDMEIEESPETKMEEGSRQEVNGHWEHSVDGKKASESAPNSIWKDVSPASAPVEFVPSQAAEPQDFVFEQQEKSGSEQLGEIDHSTNPTTVGLSENPPGASEGPSDLLRIASTQEMSEENNYEDSYETLAPAMSDLSEPTVNPICSESSPISEIAPVEDKSTAPPVAPIVPLEVKDSKAIGERVFEAGNVPDDEAKDHEEKDEPIAESSSVLPSKRNEEAPKAIEVVDESLEIDSKSPESSFLEPSTGESSQNKSCVKVQTESSDESQELSTSEVIALPESDDNLSNNQSTEHVFIEPTQPPNADSTLNVSSDVGSVLTVNTTDDPHTSVTASSVPVPSKPSSEPCSSSTLQIENAIEPVLDRNGSSGESSRTASSSVSESSSDSEAEPEPARPQPEPVSKILERLLSASDTIKRVSASTPTSPSGAVSTSSSGAPPPSSPLSLPNSAHRRSFPGASRLSMIADRLTARAVQSAVNSIGTSSSSTSIFGNLLCVVQEQPNRSIPLLPSTSASVDHKSTQPSTSTSQPQVLPPARASPKEPAVTKTETTSQSVPSLLSGQVVGEAPTIPTASAPESSVDTSSSAISDSKSLVQEADETQEPMEVDSFSGSLLDSSEPGSEISGINEDASFVSPCKPKGRPRGSKNRRKRSAFSRRGRRVPKPSENRTEPFDEKKDEEKQEGSEGSDEFD